MGITLSDIFRGEEHRVLDEVGQGAQDEGHKEVHVDVVAGAVEPPGGRERKAVGARATGAWPLLNLTTLTSSKPLHLPRTRVSSSVGGIRGPLPIPQLLVPEVGFLMGNLFQLWDWAPIHPPTLLIDPTNWSTPPPAAVIFRLGL